MRTRPQTGAGLAGLAFAALALIAGCGGGSENPAPAPDPRATAAYVERVDPICKRFAHRLALASKDFEAVQHRAGAAGQEEAVAERYRAAAAQIDRFAADVAAVRAPPADSTAIDSWLAAKRGQAAAQRELADALAAPGPVGDAVAGSQERLRSEVVAARDAIADLGFRYCE